MIRQPVIQGVKFSRPLGKYSNPLASRPVRAYQAHRSLPRSVEESLSPLNPRFPQGHNNYNNL